MREPTALYKAKLIETERNNRGAPIKNMHVEVHLVEVIEDLKKKYLYSAVAEETQPVPNEPVELAKEKSKATLQFSVDMDSLNPKQKRLLNDFLSTL